MHRLNLIIFGLLLPSSNGFQNAQVHRKSFISERHPTSCGLSVPSSYSSVLFRNRHQCSDSDSPELSSSLFPRPRFDTISASGLKNVHTAGTGGVPMFGLKSFLADIVRLMKWVFSIRPKDVQNLTMDDVKPVERLKKLHGPKTYILLSVLLAKKFAPRMFKNRVFLIWLAFCFKWYRARYVFKVPVWDRQPNWNNIITSKDQEKDLKAFTCKTCGSTIFIAKSREFFFEGDTGIGGLGCFSCGAKGKDNFEMDRDRIVEDVEDIDDYFDYERPLDFVSAAERRELLKNAKGNEDAANQLLLEKEEVQVSEEPQAATDAAVNGATGNMDDNEESEVVADAQEEEKTEETPVAAPSPKAEKEAKKPKKTPISSAGVDDDEDMDLLDMDDL
uniref:Uncharacterized protein n=1 Tax=Pseudo-nitzschia australis TaxID=44445 RepID=A0A7S4AXQ1_9STRA